MHGVLLQDWTCLRASGATTVVQSELLWLDVEGYRDVVFWLECKEVNVGGATAVILSYQTSPTKDDALFSSMSLFPLGVTSVPFITKVLEAQDPTIPLSKWLRWRVSLSGSPSSDWGATFRIFCALNPSGAALNAPSETSP